MTSKFDILILLGTFLPLLGSGLTVLLASIYSGYIRWAVLFVIPALTLVLCWVWADTIWQDGNMLAMALFYIYLITLLLYYPVLTVSGLIIMSNMKQNATTRNTEGD